MRVIYLHQYFVPPEGHGGTRSYEFARRLIANGHEVIMITSSAMLPEKYQTLQKTSRIEIAGIPTIVIPVPYSNEMSFPNRIQAFLRFALLASRAAMQQQADVVFATSTPLTIALPGIATRLWQRIPMVFEVRDLWPELPIAICALRNPFMRVLARALEWIAYHSSAHVVALSPGMAEGVIKRGIAAERVTVIPNSCDLDVFDVPMERGAPIRQRLSLTQNQPLIVYTGAFGLINGVDYLVNVANAMCQIDPNIHFLLIGSGVQKEKITVYAKDIGVLDVNTSIWESLPKAELSNVLAAATVATSLFIPLRPMWNNSANKFFDALAAGKPIAINYGGWQADLLNETGAGIVLPQDDPIEGAYQLAAFVQDNAQLQAAGEAARHLARTRFDRDKMAHQLENILRSVVGE